MTMDIMASTNKFLPKNRRFMAVSLFSPRGNTLMTCALVLKKHTGPRSCVHSSSSRQWSSACVHVDAMTAQTFRQEGLRKGERNQATGHSSALTNRVDMAGKGAPGGSVCPLLWPRRRRIIVPQHLILFFLLCTTRAQGSHSHNDGDCKVRPCLQMCMWMTSMLHADSGKSSRQYCNCPCDSSLQCFIQSLASRFTPLCLLLG